MTASAANRQWSWIRTTRVAMAGIVGATVAGLAFPEKVAKAYEDSTRILAHLPRPAFALWYQFVGNQDAKAFELVRRLNPVGKFCVASHEMVDLMRDGWRADFIVVYGIQSDEPGAKCGLDADGSPSLPRPSLAVFSPMGFDFHYVGTMGDGDDLPSEWEAQYGFLFRYYHGTTSPSVDVAYLYDGQLFLGGNIKLTDSSHHEYDLQLRNYDRGVIAWGTPEGLFHMEIGSDGKFIKDEGLPDGFARQNSLALELRWTGEAFVDRSGEALSDLIFKESVLKIPSLSQVYLSGCEVEQGFVSSPFLPGAVMPDFEHSPSLLCGGVTDDEAIKVRVERADK